MAKIGTKSKLDELRKDQTSLREQLAELDTYLATKMRKEKKPPVVKE